MKKKTCSVDGCDRKHSAKGYCSVHYARVARTGETETKIRLVGADLEDRLWWRSRVDGDCWVSDRAPTRRVRNDGRGAYRGIRIGDEMVPVHLASYRHFIGPIPPGMQVHHKCERKECWRPAHLELLTPDEHQFVHRKTHCKRGHPMTEENLYQRIDEKGRLYRRCRPCNASRKREAYERKSRS